MPKYVIKSPTYHGHQYIFADANNPAIVEVAEKGADGKPITVPDSWRPLAAGEEPPAPKPAPSTVPGPTMSQMGKAQADLEKKQMDRLHGGKK